MLISRGAKLNLCNDGWNHSPLDQCAWHTNAAEAKLLLEAGADPKAGSGLYTEQKAQEHGNLAEFQAQARGEAASSFVDPNIVVASAVTPDGGGDGSGRTLIEVLRELQTAFQQGLLTEEEFEAAKEKALEFLVRGSASDYVQTAVAVAATPKATAGRESAMDCPSPPMMEEVGPSPQPAVVMTNSSDGDTSGSGAHPSSAAVSKESFFKILSNLPGPGPRDHDGEDTETEVEWMFDMIDEYMMSPQW